MSVTKLKTVGNWQTAYWQNQDAVDARTNVRGRVITGLLTGGDSRSDVAAVAQDHQEDRTR